MARLTGGGIPSIEGITAERSLSAKGRRLLILSMKGRAGDFIRRSLCEDNGYLRQAGQYA